MSTFIAHVMLGEKLKKFKLSLSTEDNSLLLNDEAFFVSSNPLFIHYSPILLEAIKHELLFSNEYLPEDYEFEFEHLKKFINSDASKTGIESALLDIQKSKHINNYILHWLKD